jgi:DEAD/DEAH box helicase domain-containing protein
MVVLDRVVPEVLPSARDCAPRDDETAAAFAQRIAPLWGAPEFPLAAGDPWLEREIAAIRSSRKQPEQAWRRRNV